MDIYQRDKSCPKCGTKPVFSYFVAADSHGGSIFDTDSKCDRHRIKRTCENCRFHWYELPLDSPEAIEAQAQQVKEQSDA